MGQIQVLSFEVANLIAAGEVVDRPASAIKEMMENAIDAGAAHITVEIQNGGVSFMRVSDDGCGMSAEDLPMAIRRHATSKIRSAEDLDGITTLGFRGEALAAISSVSDMRILSKRREDAMGAMLEVQGGSIRGVSEQGCRNGTTIIVEHLFANVPARRKFLKRDATEAMAVSANVERVALSHPEIAVRLIVDGVLKLETAGDGQLKSAIYAVYGREFTSKLIPLEGELEGIRVEGFISRSDNVKANRNGQNFFINHRYIKSRTAQAALEQAYVSYLPPEKYPCCVMNIALNPARVDVNVHPAKLEVKFSNEKPVFEAIYYTVREALEQNTTRPALDVNAFQTGSRSTAGRSAGRTTGESATGAFGPSTGRPGGRVSDMTVPLEVQRPSSLQQRQISAFAPHPSASFAQDARSPVYDAAQGSGIPAPVAPTPPPERMTAEAYIRMYVHGAKAEKEEKGKEKPTVKSFSPSQEERQAPHAPMQEHTREAFAPVQASQDADMTPDIPMEVYEEEARRFGATIPPENAAPMYEAPAYPTSAHEAPAPEAPKPSTPVSVPPSTEADVSETAIPSLDMCAEPEPYRILGEAFHAYVFVEQGDCLYVIDKHAAHERIIFERLKANLRSKAVESQLMLLPIQVPLTMPQLEMMQTYRQELENIGFSFTCQHGYVSVEEIPCGIETGAVVDMVQAFVEQLAEGTGDPKITRDALFEKALFQASCKAAIKAGRDYPPELVAWVVDQLMRLPDITFCPHGRPVAMEMKKRTLDHQFERC